MRTATTPNVVAVMTIPPATNTSVLLPPSERARSSSSAPVTAPKATQHSRGAPVRTVMMAPTTPDDEKAASRRANQLSARIALSAKRSAVSGSAGDASRGDNPASTIDNRAADPSRPSDIKAATEPMAYDGAAVSTSTSAPTAMTIATHKTAVNVIAPQPDRRIASTEVTAAVVAASNALGTPGAPGTARNPATAPNAVAIKLSASPAIASRYARCAITAKSTAMKPANVATPAALKSRILLIIKAFRIRASAPTPVRQPAATAPVSRVACRCRKRSDGRVAASSVADTASATSS